MPPAPARGEPAGPDPLRVGADEILLVGDSVTAGVYFLSLSDASAADAWSARLLRRLGIPPTLPRLPRPYPLDSAGLVRDGFGFGGWRYVSDVVPNLLRRSPLFAEGEGRNVLAAPGQTVRELLVQSRRNKGDRSSAWALAGRLLPPRGTLIEEAERAGPRRRWIALWIGANDLLADLGMVGSARPPSPEEFERDYGEIVDRLRALLAPGVPGDHFLVFTLPDITGLPLFAPVPETARDSRNRPFPEGTKTSAFLAPWRPHRYEAEEVFTPGELDRVRALGHAFNGAIARIAERRGLTVVDMFATLRLLEREPSFAAPASPFFSPDLHHPSARTHGVLADSVYHAMARVAGVPPAAEDTGPAWRSALPGNEELGALERKRVNVLVRSSLLALQRGHYPPRPTWVLGLALGGQAGRGRLGGAGAALEAGLDLPPVPSAGGRLSRLTLQSRWSSAVRDDRVRLFPHAGLEVRLGTGIEPLGQWRWRRLEAGGRWRENHGIGWYGRFEWRGTYLDLASDGLAPARLEAGLRLRATPGRPGHNGN